jgi:UDP-N-acetylmuramoyl-L-alanyl-D-glutamate--2,6-diaminopimelate ligase
MTVSQGELPNFDLALISRLKIASLAHDHRRVKPGDTFAAWPGEKHDGRQFIGQAIAAGAASVLWEREGFEWSPQWRVPNLGIENLKHQVGVIAAEVYGHPSSRLWMIGVTGTNGKTSCSHWLARALGRLGRKTAIVGTLGAGFPDTLDPTAHTTPDSISLQRTLAQLLEQGAQAVAMEVSSHGLAQGRVNGIAFDVAVLTNLSRDHLDFHGDISRYKAAKALLFAAPGRAVVNLDDAFGRELDEACRSRSVAVIGYGFDSPSAEVQAANLELGAAGLAFEVASSSGRAKIGSDMVGRFNAYNLLACLAALVASGVAFADAVTELREAKPVAGRMQWLGGGSGPLVVVDYAHTPDAIEQVLGSLKELKGASGRLICVFGCGGDRDRGKRPLMGEVASRLADFSIVTSDNPRSEDPRAIITEIAAGMRGEYRVEPDRAQAIAAALKTARAGDVVLIAGKGHEAYQEIAGVKRPFDDREVARRALEEMGQ